MPKTKRDWLFGHSPIQIIATSFFGAVGGTVGWLLGLPLGVLLGSLITVATLSTIGVRFGGRLPGFPPPWRSSLVPIIGVAIGSNVPADVLSQAQNWWPTLLMVVAFVPVAHASSYLLYRRVGGIDPTTALFSSMPGGYLEAIEMGDRYGAQKQMLALLQFMRIIFSIVFVPLGFAMITGQAVGSSSGATMAGAGVAMTITDVAVLVGSGVLGYFGARAIRFPAAFLAGPLLASGLAHALGLTSAAPPTWMIIFVQCVMGTALGSRFAGLSLPTLWLASRLSLASFLLSIGLAGAVALIFSDVVEESQMAIVLAFAPGGVGEMALVAISLHLSAVYVTLHHLVRIVLAVFFCRAATKYLQPR